MFDAHKYANDCISGEAPPCACACPIGLDVRDFIERAKMGSSAAAYKVFTKSASLPGVVAHICPAPCRSACIRSETDDPIELGEMERFLCTCMRDKPQSSYFIPDKKKRILVVGGGVSGITAAMRLAGRGYSVNLAEREGRLGGALWDIPEKTLPRDVLESDLEALETLKYLEIVLNKEITELSDLPYDSILVATGVGGADFGARRDETALLHLWDGVFFAGGVQRPEQDFLESMREAGDLTYIIENYVKVGRMGSAAAPPSICTFKPRADSVGEKIPTFMRPEGRAPGLEDMKGEAGRCLLCACANCVDVCDMLGYFRKSPKKTILDVSDTLNSVVLYPKLALRQIMSCTACGLCTDACPTDVDFKTVCIESRQLLRRQEKLPDAYYDYWMNDMEHANGQDSFIFYNPSGRAKYIYFPGCQMGAADPDYVRHSYGWLCGLFPGEAALHLACCGAPAYWAGDAELHETVAENIKKLWLENDKSAFILACPTCMEMFSERLPEIEAIPLWRLMADNFPESGTSRGEVSVFDPCSSRDGDSARDGIRELLTKLGYEISELPEPGRCCGHGGLIYAANTALYDCITEKNARISPHPYITYCVNCRDSFSMRGKPVLYILDAAFGAGDMGRQSPELAVRRRNREALKRSLLDADSAKAFSVFADSYADIQLVIPDGIREKMARELVLEDSIRLVIQKARETGRRVMHKESGVFTAFSRLGKLTYWVDYTESNGVYTVLNVYFHRMAIGELGGEESA